MDKTQKKTDQIMYESASTYKDYQILAKNKDLSLNEKIGFPDSYRKGLRVTFLMIYYQY